MTEAERWRAKARDWIALADTSDDPMLAQCLMDVAAGATELADEIECAVPPATGAG
jgi:hypothetical protein